MSRSSFSIASSARGLLLLLLLGLNSGHDADVGVIANGCTIFDIFEVSISSKISIISGIVAIISIIHIWPGVGVVRVSAANLDVGGGWVNAWLEKIQNLFKEGFTCGAQFLKNCFTHPHPTIKFNVKTL
jgi:hypothetical protein